MLQSTRLKYVLEALREAAEASGGEADPKLRAALLGAKVEEVMAEVAGAVESENLPHYAARVLGIFEEIGMPNERTAVMGHALQGIGKTYERLGNAPHAYDAYTRALELGRETNDRDLAAGCLRRMGRVKTRMAEWQAAAGHLDESLSLYDEIGDRRGRAETLCDVGSLHYHQGELGKAERFYSEALEIAEQLEHTSLIINLQNNLGIIANVRGDLDGAIAHYQRCIPLAERIEKEPALAQAYHNLGMAYADRGDWQAAGDHFERALRLAHKHSLIAILGSVHLNKAQMYLQLGDVDMAAISTGRALDIFRAAKNKLAEAESFRVLGDIFARRGDEITTREMFNQSLVMTTEAGSPLEVGETYRGLGLAYERLGRRERAVEALQQAVQHFERVQAAGDVQTTRDALARLRN